MWVTFLKQIFNYLFFIGLLLIASCSVLPSSETPLKNYFFQVEMPKKIKNAPLLQQSILINVPQSVAYYNRNDMLYSARLGELASYRNSQWLDTPSRLLHPLLVEYIEKKQLFNQVISASQTNLLGELRLDSEILRLQQNMYHQPPQVEFKIRVQLIDTQQRYIVASRLFHLTEDMPSADATGGVLATNRIMQQFLQALSEWLQTLASESASS